MLKLKNCCSPFVRSHEGARTKVLGANKYDLSGFFANFDSGREVYQIVGSQKKG